MAVIEIIQMESVSWTGAIGKKVRGKVDAVLKRNVGWKSVQGIAVKLRGDGEICGNDDVETWTRPLGCEIRSSHFVRC